MYIIIMIMERLIRFHKNIIIIHLKINPINFFEIYIINAIFLVSKCKAFMASMK